jgi:hypothetical protein
MEEQTNAYSVLVGKTQGKSPLGRPTHRWEDNTRLLIIKMIRKKDRVVLDWIHLAQHRDQWRAFVNTLMNIQVP